MTDHKSTDEREFLRWRPHPWHGLAAGPAPPAVVTVFVEITPFDHVKYEIDKHSGFLRIDRPQYSSSLPPTAYGFVPQTLSGEGVRALMDAARAGDGDPLDVCVVSSHSITHSEVLLTARVIGGIPMLDDGCADDKVIAVLCGDAVFDAIEDVTRLPAPLVEQLVHYFATYKRVQRPAGTVSVGSVYGAEHARAVVDAAIQDYRAAFGAGR